MDDATSRKNEIYMSLLEYTENRNDSLMKSQTVDRKEWVYSGDYRNDSEHCRNHASMNGQIVPKDEPFTLVGLDGIKYYPMYPLDPILPIDERIECKCIHCGIVSDDVLGISYEERRKLQEQVIAEDDGEWMKELDAKNRAKAGIAYQNIPVNSHEGDYEKCELANPFTLTNEAICMIKAMNGHFDKKTEKHVITMLDSARNNPKMSTYQLSLAYKVLAECYLLHGYKVNALDAFKMGLKLNASLSVKQSIKRLEKELGKKTETL